MKQLAEAKDEVENYSECFFHLLFIYLFIFLHFIFLKGFNAIKNYVSNLRLILSHWRMFVLGGQNVRESNHWKILFVMEIWLPFAFTHSFILNELYYWSCSDKENMYEPPLNVYTYLFVC